MARQKLLNPDTVALMRTVIAEATRFPHLAQLACIQRRQSVRIPFHTVWKSGSAEKPPWRLLRWDSVP